jgi:hypothetical protein
VPTAADYAAVAQRVSDAQVRQLQKALADWINRQP